MKIIVTIFLLLIGFTTVAQSKNAKATIEVDGVCMMCKDRIEKAAIKTKGVKFAEWDVKTHELDLIFDENKTSLEDIKKQLTAAGHDTKDLKATEEAYNALHACCKYRDEEVIDGHQ